MKNDARWRSDGFRSNEMPEIVSIEFEIEFESKQKDVSVGGNDMGKSQ